MRKLLWILFIALIVVVAILIACVLDTSGGTTSFFANLGGGIVGSIANTLGGIALAVTTFGAQGGLESGLLILGLMVGGWAVGMIFGRVMWPKIQSIRGSTPAPVIVHQTQPSVQIPTGQTQPAAYNNQKTESES